MHSFLRALPLLILTSCSDPVAPCRVPPGSVPTTLKLTVDGTVLKDAAGREVLLRGVNAGGRSKLPPFFPFAFAESGRPEQAGAPGFEAAAAAYLDRITSWGANVLRLPFTWEAVEPVRGEYDDTFLGRYRRLCELAGDRGLRVIVDAHQDVFSRVYCGDGFPDWALPGVAPEPPADCRDWFQQYLDEASPAAVAFGRFWANEDGLVEAFADLWTHVAAELWPVDAVVGFEILNEPFPGTLDASTYQNVVFPAFHEQVAAAIRAAAPGAPVLFDSSGQDGSNASTRVQPPQGEGLIFGPHYYGLPSVVDGFPVDRDAVIGDLGRWVRKRDDWAMPLLLGEFGVPAAFEYAVDYITACHDGLDAHLLHGTQWEVSTTADEWNQEGMSLVGLDGQETALVDAFVRAYPRAVAGVLVSTTYDAAARQGEVVYEAVADGVTELAAPARLYPDGVAVTVTGIDACASWDRATGVITVVASSGGAATVSLTPR